MSRAGCCVPRAGVTGERESRIPSASGPGPGSRPPGPGLVSLPGGRFLMGGAGPMVLPGDGEGPVREVSLAPFAIAPLTVTNADFLAFVLDTGHVTLAEELGSSLVFAGRLPPDTPSRPADGPPWWREVDGACWLRPEGPGSSIAGRLDHPVVHAAWSDAMAYCAWSGTRLPAEAEWEYAARGGLEGKLYPWGDLLHPGGEHRCNIWQGTFPHQDLGLDGFRGTAPARHYPPNGYGLFQMTGNVWEWCALPAPGQPEPPPEPGRPAPAGLRPLRGGSHLCHDSYCTRYRVSSRLMADGASTTGHIGFRVAAGPA